MRLYDEISIMYHIFAPFATFGTANWPEHIFFAS